METFSVLRSFINSDRSQLMSFEETYNYRSFSSSSSEGKSKDFKSCLRAGDNALDFELASIEGARIRLSDFRNKKHVLLEFGSIT